MAPTRRGVIGSFIVLAETGSNPSDSTSAKLLQTFTVNHFKNFASKPPLLNHVRTPVCGDPLVQTQHVPCLDHLSLVTCLRHSSLIIRGNLAGFKTPKAVVFGELPKTATGKIKKSELRQQARAEG